MALVFDTETSGLPRRNGRRNAQFTDLACYDGARLVSIAFITGAQDEKREKYFVVKPDFEIRNSHIHGITTEQALRDGVSFAEVVDYLDSIVDSVDTLVGHNIDFDINILLSELHRSGTTQCHDLIVKLLRKKQYCTMKNSIIVCRLRGSSGGFKYPKLSELYKHFFDAEFDAHHALNDSRATLSCYQKLIHLSN